MFPHIGEDGTVQLSLDLFPGEPWDGHLPRALTRGYLGLIFKPQGVRARVMFSDPAQLDAFPRRRQRGNESFRRVTAPTLLPLPF